MAWFDILAEATPAADITRQGACRSSWATTRALQMRHAHHYVALLHVDLAPRHIQRALHALGHRKRLVVDVVELDRRQRQRRDVREGAVRDGAALLLALLVLCVAEDVPRQLVLWEQS